MTKEKPLPEKQLQLYKYIAQYINDNNKPPTYRQMMIAMNGKSVAPVQSKMNRLRIKGYVDWIDGKAGTLHILKTI